MFHVEHFPNTGKAIRPQAERTHLMLVTGPARLNLCQPPGRWHTRDTPVNPTGDGKNGDPEMARSLLNHIPVRRNDNLDRLIVAQAGCNDCRFCGSGWDFPHLAEGGQL